MTKYSFAFGDIHGRLDLLQSLMRQVREYIASHNITDYEFVFLGDYVDRGPDSKGVIDYLMALEKSDPVVCLKGNHEDLMVNADPGPGLEKPTVQEWRDMEDRMGWWLQNGGIQTLNSYGIADAYVNAYQGYRKIDKAHLAWMKALPTWYETENHYFVHAGVNPHKPLNEQNDNARMWIRQEWLNSGKNMGKFVVHGHTPEREADVLLHRANLDTGAFYYGTFTCGVFRSDQRPPIELLQSKGKSGR